MLVPAPPTAPYLDRLLRWVAPQWYLRRLRARTAIAELEADRGDPRRVRRIDSERWRRVDAPPGAPDRDLGWRLPR
jgi:hypothetical protein